MAKVGGDQDDVTQIVEAWKKIMGVDLYHARVAEHLMLLDQWRRSMDEIVRRKKEKDHD